MFAANVPRKSEACYTSADSPLNPNQACVLPFKFNSKLIEECLPLGPGGRWCPTKVNEYQEYIEGKNNWGYCSTSCTNSVTFSESTRKATFSKKDIAWKGT